MNRVAIGLIGYYPFVRGYPIGPELRDRLQQLQSDSLEIELKEMNWGPIAIVQDFEASQAVYDRAILIGAVDRGIASGSVTCRLWRGGKLDTLAVQDRVFEAVTGIISLDNLLVIGEHFGIWPEETMTIEVQLKDTAFGDLVLSELAIPAPAEEQRVVGEHPLSAEMAAIVDRVVSLAEVAASAGAGGLPDIVPISASELSPLADVCHNQFMDDARITRSGSRH